MKLTDSHKENFGGHSFLVLLLAEFIFLNKFSFDLLTYECPYKFMLFARVILMNLRNSVLIIIYPV